MSNKTVIAHRGASGYLPEHTLAAKAMAYAMHPDYLEQDIVLSKDGVPIVIHDIHLDTTTNVALMYPERRRRDNRYYVMDFTFNELKTLQVHERVHIHTGKMVYPNRFPLGKSRFGIHSFQEEIEMIQGMNKSTGYNIGIYPEIKDPEFHQNAGMDISVIVLDILNEYGYSTKEDACLLQCFDSNELQRIRVKLKSELRLVQLMEFKNDINRISQFATYADGIGFWMGLLKDSKIMELAKKSQLFAHAFTLRLEEWNDTESFEFILDQLLFKDEIDGVFTDQPDLVLNFLKNKP